MNNEINFIKKYPQVLVIESGMVEDDVETKVRTIITWVRKKLNDKYYYMEVRYDSEFTEEGHWCKDAIPRFYEEVLYTINYEYNEREIHLIVLGNSIILDTNQED